MAKLVLVGNSLNRLDAGPSWSEVVTTLATSAGVGVGTTFTGKPLPIVYEHIVCRQDCDENRLKKNLADSMRRLKPNWAHERALTLAAPHLLTTNYDYCLEQASGIRRERANLKRENTYSAFRRTRIEDRCVWHLHGELDAPRTLLLGFHQYTGYVQRLRAYLTEKQSPFMNAAPDFDRSGTVFSWVDLFLRDDVHIAGLTLDYVEIHLWWLLTYKLRLRARRKSPCGTTHFYHFRLDHDGADATRLALLHDLRVVVHEIDVMGDWTAAHNEVFNQIQAAPVSAGGT